MTEKMFKARNIDDLLRALDDWYTLFSPSEMRALLGERLRHMIGDVHREFAKTVRSAKGGSFPDKADYFTLNTRVRRYTNLGSVIIREFVEETLPTIDNEVIDVISRIPAEYRYGHHLYRKFLSALDQDLARIPYVKTMVRADAPDFFWMLGIFCLRVIRFTKRALWKFSHGKISLPNKHYYIDMAEVWRASPAWRKLLSETILNDHSTCYERDYLNKDFVEKVVEEHYGGIKNNSEKIAFLVTFELFLRIFFERRN